MAGLHKFISFTLFFLLMSSCDLFTGTDPNENNENNENEENTVETTVQTYFASGVYGDIILYEIDMENKTFTYHNETTNQSGEGEISLSTDPKLSGMYEFSINGDKFYGIISSEKAIITSMPSGRLENAICFGLSADLDLMNDFSASDIAGKYLYVDYGNLDSQEGYGGIELKSDGTYTYQIAPENEDDFSEEKHFAGAGSGTWKVDENETYKIIFSEDGMEYYGTANPGKAILFDNGVGKGFTVGLIYPENHIGMSAVAGKYHFLDFTTEGYKGVGYYDIPSSGSSFEYYSKYTDNPSLDDEGTAENFEMVPTMNNLFRAKAEYDGEIFTTWLFFLPGEIMLHYCAGADAMVSCGIGAKVE